MCRCPNRHSDVSEYPAEQYLHGLTTVSVDSWVFVLHPKISWLQWIWICILSGYSLSLVASFDWATWNSQTWFDCGELFSQLFSISLHLGMDANSWQWRMVKKLQSLSAKCNISSDRLVLRRRRTYLKKSISLLFALDLISIRNSLIWRPSVGEKWNSTRNINSGKSFFERSTWLVHCERSLPPYLSLSATLSNWCWYTGNEREWVLI